MVDRAKCDNCYRLVDLTKEIIYFLDDEDICTPCFESEDPKGWICNCNSKLSFDVTYCNKCELYTPNGVHKAVAYWI